MKYIAIDIAVIVVYLFGFLVGYITNRYELRDLRKKTDELKRFSGTKGGKREIARMEDKQEKEERKRHEHIK